MSTSIDWTDDTGPAFLTNNQESPGDRFTNWEPRSVPAGSAADALEGSPYIFEDREDHSASFALVGIPDDYLDLCLRLQSHLMGGGTVRVSTGDTVDSVYPTCCIVDGSEVTLDLTDKEMLEYTMTFNLLNVDESRVQMVCVY